MEALEKAEQLKNELDSLRPLDTEAEARIMQKFRLDWNYHSNNLEGNSLTYGETKALILFGITAQGKPLKDHFEITGHNEAINWILEVVKDETPLTEKFIRELHTLLLKESSYKEAQTLNGKPTRRKIEVGKYKTQPNHVITVTGETFYFATPEETPAKMHDLIEWFRKEKEKSDVNPIILAALFHYRFIRIHPFDDGNGRVARILMNFILMQFGYPPVIIKTEDKENYYIVLRLADADELEPFIEYITQNLIRSLEIMIKGAKGESIEEPDDLDKELVLLEKQFESKSPKVEKYNSRVTIEDILKNIFPNLISEFYTQSQKFTRFYFSYSLKLTLRIDEPNRLGIDSVEVFKIEKSDIDKLSNDSFISEVTQKLLDELEKFNFKNIFNIELNFDYENFNRLGFFETFGAIVFLEFNEKTYLISDISEEARIDKTYSEIITPKEISSIVNAESQRHKEQLKGLLEKN